MKYKENNFKPKKCNQFSFQKLNKYFLFPFFIPIICFSTKFFSETMKTDGNNIRIENVTIDNTHTFVFIYQIIQSLCLFLGGLSYFIVLYKIKTSDTKSNNNNQIDKSINTEQKEINSSITLESRVTEKYLVNSIENYKKRDLKKILIVVFMPFLIIIYNMSIAYGVKHPQLEKRVYFLLFITLINVFIFKKQIYKHQKLALIITLIGIIPIYTSFFVYLDTNIYKVHFDIILFTGSLCYSIYLVFIKYLTTNKQMSVFLLLLYQGILCTVYTLVIFSVISLAAKGDFTYITNIFNCNETNYSCVSKLYIKIIFYFILNTVLQALIFLVVYIFSPELFAISDIFSPLFSFIAQWIQEKEKNGIKIFLYVLGYLIIALGAFIYNEIIVCNFCGLNQNTWKAIDQKAYEDTFCKNLRNTWDIMSENSADYDSINEDNYIEMY